MKTDRNIASATEGVEVIGHVDADGQAIYVHSVPAYFKAAGKDLELYQTLNPAAPLYSDRFLAAKKAKESKETMTASMSAEVKAFPGSARRESFADVFGLGDAAAAKNARGNPIMCTVLADPTPEYADWVPPVDPNYIFPIDNLKAVMMGAELNMPTLAWGMHGTGKTTLLEQYCARTNRPSIRVQHTVSTEEAHILGHYVVKNGATEFEPGPLPIAMRYGLYYIADEYDFALPSVTAVYQAVLEGKQLVIKEAPPEWRIVKPHPNFRIAATGNTNGGGDDTGLYQGTQIMNAANYSRFGITIKVDYMSEAIESKVIEAQAKIHANDAIKLVRAANDIRQGFQRGDISVTISPRELINAGLLARSMGITPDLTRGMEYAFINRLNDTDRKAVGDFIQRYFG